MSTVLEEMHHIEPHIQVGRARAGVIMLMLSDALSVVAILAAGGYLSALNVLGQFKGTDHAPAFVPGLALAVILVLSGVFYYFWERGVRTNGGRDARALFIVAWVLMIVALVAQVWICTRLGYASPLHAYASLILLLTWYSAVHLLLAAFIGLLLFGRITRDRLVGHEYIALVTGYWWYYTIIAGLLMWLFSLVIS